MNAWMSNNPSRARFVVNWYQLVGADVAECVVTQAPRYGWVIGSAKGVSIVKGILTVGNKP